MHNMMKRRSGMNFKYTCSREKNERQRKGNYKENKINKKE